MDLSTNGKRFTPPIKDIFRAFEECKYDDLRVVIIGNEPYNEINQASGVAFDGRNLEEPSKDLKYLFKSLDNTIEVKNRDKNLSNWGKQGVLLLNVSLTAQMNELNKHYAIWRPFITYLLDTLSTVNSGLVFLLLGDEAKKFKGFVGNTHHYHHFTHPRLGGYSREWEANDVFNKINEQLIEMNKTQIEW